MADLEHKHVIYTRLFSYKGDHAGQVFSCDPPDGRRWRIVHTNEHLCPPNMLFLSVVWELEP